MFSLISCGSFSLAKYIDKKNEDSILLPLFLNDGYLFAVADGVGSYAGAREASHIAIDVLMNLEHQLANRSMNRIDIDLIFKTIKSKISELSNTDAAFKDSATTLTFCYVNQFGIRIGHIGDCRLYLKDDNKLIQITKDHTRHQQLLDAKLYTAKQLKEISGKNVLTTALSRNIEMKYDEYFISINELIDFKDENNCIVINIMTDGAHNIWEKRPKFSQKTLSSPLAFSSSLLRRIERIGAEDDHSLISVKVKF